MIDRETEFKKLLGAVIQDNLKWNSYISSALKKANKRIYHIRACKKAHLPDEVGLATYITQIRPLLEYACPILGGIPYFILFILFIYLTSPDFSGREAATA